ncbi:hypothetical protein ABIC02_004064 [Bradyrhizobium sp. RT5a]
MRRTRSAPPKRENVWLHIATAALVAVMVIGSKAAWSASLEPADLTAVASPPNYDLFWVYESDAVDRRAPKIGVVPNRLEIALDSATNRPKFGVQYSSKNEPRTILLNVTVKYQFNRSQVQELIKTAQSTSDIFKGSSAAQFSLLQPSRTAFGIYQASRTPNTPVTTIELKVNPQGALALDGSLSIAADLTTIPQDELFRVLTGTDSPFGIYAIQTINSPVVTAKIGAEQNSAAASLIRKYNFIDSDKLAPILTGASIPPGFLDWLFGRTKNTLDIRLVLGAPRIEVVDGVTRFGWLIARDDIQGRLKEYEASRDGGGMRRLQDNVQIGAFLALEGLCERYPNNFINLDDGKTGCGGLKP